MTAFAGLVDRLLVFVAPVLAGDGPPMVGPLSTPVDLGRPGVERLGDDLLLDWRLHDLPDLKCWPAGTGHALADWLRSRGHQPVYFTAEENEERRRGLDAPPPADGATSK